MVRKKSVFDYINYLILTLIGLIMVYPFLYILAMSLSDSASVQSGSITFYPKNINLEAYKNILGQSQFWVGYRNTIIYTVLGTVIGVAMTAMCAYPLSKKYLPGRGFFLKLLTVTMFFSGGLIPTFLLIRSLGWINTTAAMVIPGAVQAYYVIITRTFFEGIPEEMSEAASIDGLNDIGILTKIYMPLSKPILATIAMYFAVAEWNGWFNALIYLQQQEMMPVMIFLRNIVNGAEVAANNPEMVEIETVISPIMRSATIVAVILPIICVYPFIQKYFVKGIMIGSVKG